MNTKWTTIRSTGTIIRDYTDPDGPIPTVTASINLNPDDGRYWWHITVTTGRDKWSNPIRTTIASGQSPATRHALPALKARLTRLGRAAAYLERETATAKALADLEAALDIAGTTPADKAMTAGMRRCAWERDMYAARLAALQNTTV